MTDSFEFPNGLMPMDGWIRLGIIFPAALAAALAGAAAGFAAYARSIRCAYRDARDGKPVPAVPQSKGAAKRFRFL